MGRSQEGAATTELKKSTISLPAELYWRFQEEQSRRRLSNQAAVAQAIQQWLEGRAEVAAPRERLAQNEHWHGILDEILTSSDQEAISPVQQNLLVFHRLMRNAEKLSSVGPPPL